MATTNNTCRSNDLFRNQWFFTWSWLIRTELVITWIGIAAKFMRPGMKKNVEICQNISMKWDVKNGDLFASELLLRKLILTRKPFKSNRLSNSWIFNYLILRIRHDDVKLIQKKNFPFHVNRLIHFSEKWQRGTNISPQQGVQGHLKIVARNKRMFFLLL